MKQSGGLGGVFKAHAALTRKQFVHVSVACPRQCVALCSPRRVELSRYLRGRHHLDPRNPYNPYSVQVIPRVLVPLHDYATASREGVTRHFHGDVEFTPWDKWCHHFYVFHHIRQMRFFRTFRVWRVFNHMKRYLRKRRMAVAALALTGRLHILQPALQRPVVAITCMLHDMLHQGLVHDPNEGFVEMQKPWVR